MAEGWGTDTPTEGHCPWEPRSLRREKSFGTLRSEHMRGICYTGSTQGVFCKTIRGKYILRYKGSDPFIILPCTQMWKRCFPLFSHLRAAADSTVDTCSGEEGAMQRAALGGDPILRVLSCPFHRAREALRKLSRSGTMLRESESWEFHLHSSVTPTINQPSQFQGSSCKPQASWATVTSVTITITRKIRIGSHNQLQCAVYESGHDFLNVPFILG